MRFHILLSIIVCLLVAFTTASTTTKETQSVEDRIRQELKVWENNWSGFPINCRRMVDTLSSDGIVEYPAGKHVISGGHKRIFSRCEGFITENFSQIQSYITGTPLIVGHNVAFERATLFMTKNNCRLYNRGIVTIKYDKDFKIKELKDYFDLDELVEKYQACQFPGSPLPDVNAEKKAEESAATFTTEDKKVTEDTPKQKDEL
ncbi:hypothetical protein DFA_05026 [Cavenderia fasciculata]|uniref:SnoaL-like domain-containing protein n=1 Tax=Cavenderia fasciculata TaxID=261658 RepID=F4PN03_CACFS|nr:uncharacterized protein DFA_05026 [Cavenderia fasciculata]EGG22896.1 hypothetical protein DFA_05026 [Cavenderia fasciculata]|eukprot:XP_004360747.1 hypothetical protein DFA_05026 [Cavenderia fasciculata]